MNEMEERIEKARKRISSLRAKDRASYEYAATRARAMASKLLKEDDYEKFMKMDMNEIVRFLEEREYRREIDAIGTKATKIVYLEQVLNENFANSINRLLSFTPENSPVRTYLMRYDVANIKTILRAKETKRTRLEIKRNLIGIGIFDKKLLEKLVEAEGRAEVIRGLNGTPYYKVLKEHEKKKSEELEDYLDKFYFEIVLEGARAHKSLLDLIKTEVDMKNVLLVFRLKEVKGVKLEKFLIEGGNLEIKKLLELSKLDIFGIINQLKTRDFWKFAPTNTKELDKIESGLRKYVVITGFRLLRNYVPSFDTLLGYVIAKEREINNVRITARSKTSKNPEDALNIRARIYLR